jgi:hypothetical protein
MYKVRRHGRARATTELREGSCGDSLLPTTAAFRHGGPVGSRVCCPYCTRRNQVTKASLPVYIRSAPRRRRQHRVDPLLKRHLTRPIDLVPRPDPYDLTIDLERRAPPLTGLELVDPLVVAALGHGAATARSPVFGICESSTSHRITRFVSICEGSSAGHFVCACAPRTGSPVSRRGRFWGTPLVPSYSVSMVFSMWSSAGITIGLRN